MYLSLAFPESRVWDKSLLAGSLFLNVTSGSSSTRQREWNRERKKVSVRKSHWNDHGQLVFDPTKTIWRSSWMWLRPSIQGLKREACINGTCPPAAETGLMHGLHFQDKYAEPVSEISMLQNQKGLKAKQWEVLGTGLKGRAVAKTSTARVGTKRILKGWPRCRPCPVESQSTSAWRWATCLPRDMPRH